MAAGGGHFGCPQITFYRISDRYATFWMGRQFFWMRRQCQLSNLSEIFGFVMHTCVKFEERSLNPSK